MGLPGVKVGPLDPDATESFGQVAARNSARTLIRLHSQMYPPQLRRALTRPLAEGHTKAVHERLEDLTDYLHGLRRENGDPLIPEGAVVRGASVRGDRATGQVLTVQYELPSGRIGKWFVPYTPEHLPEVHELGQFYERVHQMKSQGLVAFDQEATGQELYRRQLAQSQGEVARLRAALEGRSAEQAENIPEQQTEVATDESLLEEVEKLRRERQELLQRNAQLESIYAARGGGVPTDGLEDDIGGGQQDAGAEPGSAAQEPPFEGYEGLNAEQLRERIKSEDTSDDEVRAILEYETSHASRRTVVSAGEQRLDRSRGE